MKAMLKRWAAKYVVPMGLKWAAEEGEEYLNDPTTTEDDKALTDMIMGIKGYISYRANKLLS